MSAPAVALALSRWAEYASVRRQPRRADRISFVLVGRAGAVPSYSCTSRDAAQVLVRPPWRAQDGAFFSRATTPPARPLPEVIR